MLNLNEEQEELLKIIVDRFKAGGNIMDFGRMVEYKFRAECMHDVAEFFRESVPFLNILKLEFIPQYLDIDDEIKIPVPDVEVLMTTSKYYDIEKIKHVMSMVPDSHVMVETVKIYKEYTGERDYSLAE